MKNYDALRLDLDLLEQAGNKATSGSWTTENPSETKWNVYDAEGNDIAIAQQVRSLKEDPKQEERTANAQWIAIASPKSILELTNKVRALLDRVEELEGKNNV